MDRNALDPQLTVLARAVYDNNAEVPQELSFSRGDVLMVIKKDPEGFEGWWICNLKGKVGIVPGNRLELLGAITPKKAETVFEPYDTLPRGKTESTRNTTAETFPSPASPTTSVYANCYENFPAPPSFTAYSHSGGTPTAPTPTPRFVKGGGILSHSTSFPPPLVNGQHRSGEETDSSLGTLATNTTYQNIHIHDNLQRRSVRPDGSSETSTTGRPTVRFIEPNDDVTSPSLSSSITSSPVGSSISASGGYPIQTRSLPIWTTLVEKESIATHQPASTSVLSPQTCNLQTINQDSLGRSQSQSSSSSDYSRCRDGMTTTNKPNTVARLNILQRRIKLLLGEMQATVGKQQSGQSNSRLWLLKMHQFEEGLFAELSHLQGFIDFALHGKVFENSQLKQSLKTLKHELLGEEERLAFACHQLHEAEGDIANLSTISTSTQQISTLVQRVYETMQHNWTLLPSPEISEAEEASLDRSSSFEDRIATLTRRTRSDSSPSIESAEPDDLASILLLYSAQLHSHCALIKETADEFLGSLHGNLSDSSSNKTRGYKLPTGGVLIAHSKFLLRCSSQLVNLAANLCVALINCTSSSSCSSSEQMSFNTEALRTDIEVAGNSVCESLKGLIAQTKEVAGYLSTPSFELASSTAMPSKPIVSGPEMERLVGSIIDVVTSTKKVKALVSNSLNVVNIASAISSS